MQRILEPELMEDPVQAAAYAAADFSDPHGLFINKFQEVFPGRRITGHVLDLGCGPADISLRFARAYPECRIDGAGALVMTTYGRAKELGVEPIGELLSWGVAGEIGRAHV